MGRYNTSTSGTNKVVIEDLELDEKSVLYAYNDDCFYIRIK